MFIRVNRDSYRDGFLGAPPSDFKKGGLPVGEDNAAPLLTILEGPSSYQPYLKRAMANRATTLPARFLRVVTSIAQVPPYLRRIFGGSVGGRIAGGTIDRWTRTIYVIPAPGRRVETRLEYALHECVHLFAHPHAPTQKQCPQPCIGTFQRLFETGFGEGLTQVITEDIMNTQGISLYYRDRPYEGYAVVVRELVKVFGLDAMARAYFFGEVQALRAAMEARWGLYWHAVKIKTNSGQKDKALAQIKELEAAYRKRLEEEKRLEDLIRKSPRGDFPTPSRERSFV